MPLTTEQLVERRSKIGSSDAAAILGVDPYRTPRDVWMEKTEGIEVKQLDNEAIRIGNEAEPMLLRMLAQDQNLEQHALQTGITFIAEDGVNASNPDAIINELAPSDDPNDYSFTEIVEAKSTGLDGWGESEVAGDVPLKVLIQTHHQMYVTGAVICWVPVLLGRFGLKFKVYRVNRDDDLAATIGKKCVDWWASHVDADVAPEGDLSLEIAKQIPHIEGRSIALNAELVETWNKARDMRLKADKLETSALANVLAILGEAEIGESMAGTFTYYEQHRKGYTVQPSSFRVPRFKKAK